ncbi:MAG: TIGR01458 family HAD-type hydrolase [Planctomycetota bacterium]|nr:MAG: TIGR01458 family HAD-type hydrolase [Planctomycetota bacterium]
MDLRGRCESIRACLLDIDGTLLVDGKALAGSRELLHGLLEREIPFRLCTNTTRASLQRVTEQLQSQGLPVQSDHVLVPSKLAVRRIQASGKLRTGFLVPRDTRQDFDGLRAVHENPDWVVVGDLGPAFRWERLNRAFQWLRGGAQLIALQKNRCWRQDDEWRLDAGPFVAALEYASGQQAELMGKPAPAFFQLALQDLEAAPNATLMLGDDLFSDVGGAQQIGCTGLLVTTGKFEAESLKAPGAPTPDGILTTAADLLDYLPSPG